MAITTLGIGSDGVLSSDLIDKLKDADKSATIKPIENRIKSNDLKIEGIKSIKTLVNELSDLASSISDPSLYSATKANLNGDSISANVANDIDAQTIKIDVKSLAKNSIKESQRFANKDEVIGAGNMHLEINGNSYDIAISDDDTLESLSKKIEDATDGNIKGYVLNVGGDEPYRLMLKSTKTGTDNEIHASGDIRFYVAQAPKDAEFSVDGARVISQSNEIKDLIDGVDITLKSTGETTIDIKKDSEQLVDKVSQFADKYNQINTLISKLTSYDADKKVGAVLQGSSEIREIKNRLRDIFDTSFTTDGKMSNDFGFDIDKKGNLSFDSTKFKDIVQNDPTSIKDFFLEGKDGKGLFKKFDTELFNMAHTRTGLLKSYESNLQEKANTLNESLRVAKEKLDTKYELLSSKFASYDKVIGRLKNSSDYLTNLIESQYKK